MADKFNRPPEPSHALYHDVLCGNVEAVQRMMHVLRKHGSALSSSECECVVACNELDAIE